MSYEKQTWANGDVITAEGLNHMEDGIAGAGGSVLVVNVEANDSTWTLDKTWNEIKGAVESGKMIYVNISGIDDYRIFYYYTALSIWGQKENDVTYTYGVEISNYNIGSFTTHSADGYPSVTFE